MRNKARETAVLAGVALMTYVGARNLGRTIAEMMHKERPTANYPPRDVEQILDRVPTEMMRGIAQVSEREKIPGPCPQVLAFYLDSNGLQDARIIEPDPTQTCFDYRTVFSISGTPLTQSTDDRRIYESTLEGDLFEVEYHGFKANLYEDGKFVREEENKDACIHSMSPVSKQTA